MDLEPGSLDPLDHLEPFRPVWVDQNIDVARLEEKRSVPDPGETDLAVVNFRELRRRVIPGAFGEERRDQNLGEEVAFVPVPMGTQTHASRAFGGGAFLRFLTNNVSATFF